MEIPWIVYPITQFCLFLLGDNLLKYFTKTNNKNKTKQTHVECYLALLLSIRDGFLVFPNMKWSEEDINS